MTGRGRAKVGRGRLPPRQDDPQAQPGAQAPPPQPQPPVPAQQPPAGAPAQPQGRGRGRGRGWGTSQPAPQGIAPAGIAPASRPGTGRAGLMLGVPRVQQLQQPTAPTPPVQPPQPTPQPPAQQPQYEEPQMPARSGVGRAAFRGGVAPAGEAPQEVAKVTKQMSKMAMKAADKREHFRLMRVLKYLDYDDIRTKPPVPKIGGEGRPLPLITNYFKFEKFPEYHLNQYHVDFNPQVERNDERQRLLDEHGKALGRNRAFDGMILFTPHRLERTPMQLCSKRENDEIVTITIRDTGEVPKTSPTFIQVVNIQMRKALALLQLRQIGHHYFDPSKPVEIPNKRLWVMPGFITAVKFHEHGLLLGVDIAHKVLRMESALDVLVGLRKKGITNKEDLEKEANRALLGATVLTRYNNRTYRVDDIDFESNPMSTFDKNNEKITYMQYYKSQYGIDIKSKNQPMLVSRPKAKDIRGGRPNNLYLVPELCAMTGLTDDQRAEGQLMRAMAESTRVNPDKRIERMLNFREQLCKTERTLELLKSWEIVPERNLLQTQGRVLPRQDLFMLDTDGKTTVTKQIDFPPHRPDWSQHLKTKEMVVGVALDDWIVIYHSKDYNFAGDIVGLLRRDGPRMGIPMAEPRWIQLDRDSPESYRKMIDQEMTTSTQMILAVVPNQKKDRYDAIKKICCVDRPCPSQVVCAKMKPNVLRSACTKIAVQMNCKMGGVPWTAQMPLPDTMYIGIDTYHDSAQKKKSAVGFVATLDRHCTRYFCECSIQDISGEELANTLTPMVRIATTEFEKVNRKKPQKYIIYRDGVGDGMLRMVNEYEKRQIVDAIMEMYSGEDAAQRPLVYFVVVKKRILTRLFTKEMKNPPPGTVVDRDITTEFWFDFFLISQSVGQGTVNPVHYNCIEMPRVKGICLSADQLQILTYRMCHLYYNWAGTIRVPMICMYAHKLAFLVGQSLHVSPHAALCNRLFFL